MEDSMTFLSSPRHSSSSCLDNGKLEGGVVSN